MDLTVFCHSNEYGSDIEIAWDEDDVYEGHNTVWRHVFNFYE